MLCNKDLILSTKPYAKEIRSKSWLITITAICLLLLSFTGIILIPFFTLRLVCSIFAGLLLVRMFVIYHDQQHHTILYKSWVANLLMTVFGIYILAPSSIWKRSHDHHHNHNSKLFSAGIGSYPIATRKQYLEMSKMKKFIYLATRHPLTIIFGYFSMFIYGMCLNSFLSNPRKHIDALLALVLHIAAIVVIFHFLGWQTWFLLFFLPFFIASGLGSYIFYAQHNFPGVTFSQNKQWSQDKAAMESSSFIIMNPVMSWFTGNVGYHHIHHLNSRIPFYRLPEVMNQIPELQNCKTTTLRFRDVWACFHLKIWDQEKNQMIGLKDIPR